MKIQTFPITEYKKCPIYIRRMETTFEYITIIQGEIYQQHIDAKPVLYRRLLYPLGLTHRYTDDEVKRITAYVRKMAEATIDTISNKKKPDVLKKN